MIRFLGHFAVTAAAMMLLARQLPGFAVRDWQAALLAALVLGFVNAVVKPVLFLLTLPITFLTLGLFLLVLNAGMLALTAYLVPGFRVTDLGSLALASILLALVGVIYKWVTGDDKRDSRRKPKELD